MATGIIQSIRTKKVNKIDVVIYLRLLNNHFNEQHDHWAWLAAETNNPLHIQHAQSMQACLIEYVQPIKELHFELKTSISQLTERLDKNISEIDKE